MVKPLSSLALPCPCERQQRELARNVLVRHADCGRLRLWILGQPNTLLSACGLEHDAADVLRAYVRVH